MSGSVNKVILIGNLGRDPEVRTFQNGGRACNLRIATSETWRDKQSGERRERTEWHTVVIYNENLIRVAEQYLRKGSKVYLEGQLETRKASGESGGPERYFTEVVLRQFRGELTLLDSRGGGEGGGSPGGGYGDADDFGRSGVSQPRRPALADEDRGGGGGGRGRMNDIMDDDIPF